MDKYFFQNLVKYNEQPYGELVAANFFELDFSPDGVNDKETFNTLREKIVLDLTVKVLQVQQLEICGTRLVTPDLPGLTPQMSPPQQKIQNTRGNPVQIVTMRLTQKFQPLKS